MNNPPSTLEEAMLRLMEAEEALSIYDQENPNGLWWDGVNLPGVEQNSGKYATEYFNKHGRCE